MKRQFFLVVCLCTVMGFISCNDEISSVPLFSIGEQYLQQDFGAGSISVAIPVETNLETSQWSVESDQSWCIVDKKPTTSTSSSPEFRIRLRANEDPHIRKAVITVKSTAGDFTIQVRQSGSAGVEKIVLESDIKVTPTGGEASESQPNHGIELSYDGKFEKNDRHYHSKWQDTEFPVTLKYKFSQKPDLDYLIYYTRNGNGNFGEGEIYITTESDGRQKLKDFDFHMQSAPSRVDFPHTYSKVTEVEFIVESGYGNFVSCDEMEFYKKNTEKSLDKQLLEVFTDLTCSTLKEGVTDEQIEALPGYFYQLAIMLRDDTYDPWEKKFRIRNYEPYSIPEEWAETLMTKRYSNLDNPTGIYVEPGDSLIILVGETYGNTLSIQCIGEEKNGDYMQTAVSGETYFLQEGVNKVGFNQIGGGMLFVMYNVTDLQAASSQPITIHIAPESGKVSGFFDVDCAKSEDENNDEYVDLINKADYKYFCVRGERIMFFFHRDKMQQAVPRDIMSAIGLWDSIIGWQQELMGIEDVRPSKVNNHLFAISPEGSYMWASDYRIGFVYTYLDNILLKENVMAVKDNAWGPSHEIGHIHQRAINWPSSTESSNNLFSNYILYKLGRYCSRGTELSALATARCVNHEGWWNMGSATHQNEDTEIHMRMNWQLWNYYHRLGHNPRFWQTLFKLLREDRIVERYPGEAQLKFAMKAADAAQEDLTEFFEMWGFFVPADTTVEQYGTFLYKVTEEMIREAKTHMKKYTKKPQPFYYLEDRRNTDEGIDGQQGKIGDVGHYDDFKANKQLTDVKCTRTGRRIDIQNGAGAVAFEIRKDVDDLDKLPLFFSTSFSFDVPESIGIDDAKIYAVQADGKRIECQQQN